MLTPKRLFFKTAARSRTRQRQGVFVFAGVMSVIREC